MPKARLLVGVQQLLGFEERMFTGHLISVQLGEECKNVQRGNAEPSATHKST